MVVVGAGYYGLFGCGCRCARKKAEIKQKCHTKLKRLQGARDIHT